MEVKFAAEGGKFHRLLRPKAALLPSRPKAVFWGWGGVVFEYTKTYKNWSVIRDYRLILWEIEAMHYILLLGMPKPF